MPEQSLPPNQRSTPPTAPAGSNARDPALKDLLKRLAGRKVALSTRCGTFRQTVGVVKEVFEDFFLFLTVEERAMDQTPQRHWITVANLGVITEEPRLTTEEIPITRYEL
jgi:hypothetical protein